MKTGVPREKPLEQVERRQQIQLTCARSRNQTQVSLVEGEHSHHCAIPAPVVQTSGLTFNMLYDRGMASWFAPSSSSPVSPLKYGSPQVDTKFNGRTREYNNKINEIHPFDPSANVWDILAL